MQAADVAVPEKERYTHADYAALPEGAPYELIHGELVMTASPSVLHQRITGRLFRMLSSFVDERELGEVFVSPIDVHLTDENTPQPDLAYVARERLGIVGEQAIEGAPDLVVEVLSPATAYYDLRTKKRLYAEAGVVEYWIVDPIEASVEVYRGADGAFDLHQRATGDDRARSALLGDFAVSPADLFA